MPSNLTADARKTNNASLVLIPSPNLALQALKRANFSFHPSRRFSGKYRPIDTHSKPRYTALTEVRMTHELFFSYLETKYPRSLTPPRYLEKMDELSRQKPFR